MEKKKAKTSTAKSKPKSPTDEMDELIIRDLMTVKEIAKVTGKSEGRVRNRKSELKKMGRITGDITEMKDAGAASV